jgi:Tfp pilus assembly protein PilX
MRRAERGVVLLEILAAVLILTVAGVSLVELTAAGVRATATARDRERDQMDEDRLLAAYSLLTRGDLDLRLGIRDVGPYVVQVQRPEVALYRVAVSAQRSATIEDVVTVLYRPVPVDAP